MEEIKTMKKINYARGKTKKTFSKIFIRKDLIITLLLIIIIILSKYYPGFLSLKQMKKDLFKAFSSNPTVCLCVIAKKENLYAKEFVNHYKKLGYTHLYIYDNNDVNDEKFEDVIQDEINSGFVTIINFRGMTKGHCNAYYDCYEKYNKLYNWMSFFDFDELLSLKKEKTIQQFLSSPRYEQCVTIKINFLFYSDNGLLYYDNRTLQERFTEPLYNHPNNAWCKVMVRGGLKTNYYAVQCTPHTSHSNYPSCNSAGQSIPYNAGATRPIFTYASLNHYYTKSTEEYLIKSSRGEASQKVDWNDQRKQFKYKLYFLYNKRTKEKEDLLKRLFNMT